MVSDVGSFASTGSSCFFSTSGSGAGVEEETSFSTVAGVEGASLTSFALGAGALTSLGAEEDLAGEVETEVEAEEVDLGAS